MRVVLVTGSDGMLGSEVVRHLQRMRDTRVVSATIDSMDITDLRSVKKTLEEHRPTHLIHCAAFTQVDTAEKEVFKAFQVNAEGTKNLAFFCREMGTEFLYISTDYVFDGMKGSEYVENDEPHPINMYGKSKLEGEQNVRLLCERHKIIRTSWLNGLGGAHTRNFIETMLRIAEHKNVLSVVNDQTGKPTFTFDLAQAIVTLMDVKSYGIFHVTNTGSCTWCEFANKIFEMAGKDVSVRAITSDQFRSLAERPMHSALKNTRFESLGLALLPHWEESLREYFRRRRQARSISTPDERAPSRDAQRA